MKTVTVSRRRKTLIALLERARQGGMILRSPDGSEFILAEIDDFNREIELTRGNRELMKFLDKRAAQNETLSLAQVEDRLGLRQRPARTSRTS